MHKRCKAFSSEYQYEFTEKRWAKREPYEPLENWTADRDEKEREKFDEKNTEELLSKFISERLQTIYQLYYKDHGQRQEGEEIDLGNELVAYLRNLYYSENKGKPKRPIYTSSRLFGYACPHDLSLPLSNYQDTYGRTGGHVILKNVRKMLAAKRRRIVRSKLQSNAEREPTIIFPNSHKSFSNVAN